MNIYTLKFHEKGLESSYQNHKAGYLQIPILKFTYFLIIAIVGSNIIEKIVEDDYTYFIAKLAIITVIVGQCILFKYIKRFPIIAILVVNFSIVLLEGDFNSYQNNFDGYLYGSNQMLAHAILTIGQDFLFGVCTNISLGLIRAIITYLNTDSLSVQQYLYTIIITLGFSGIVYQCEKYQRSSYLFQEKDTKWEKILPHVIEKPFLIFTFDKEQFSFQQIAINKSLTDSQEMQFDSVSDFLKECKYEKNNLQKYLFQRYQQFNYLQEKTQCEKIEIQYRKSRLRVKLLIYCIDTIRFMLIIEAVDQSYIDLKFKYSNQLKSIQLKYNNQLKKITKLLNKKLKKQFPQLLIDLRISIFEFKTLQSIRKSKVTQVDISLIFKKLSRIFEKSYKYKIQFTCKPNTSVHTYKPELYVFLLTIIKSSKPNQQLELIFDSIQDQSTSQLTLIGADKLPQDKQFKQCVQLLFQKHVSVVNSHFWIFKEVYIPFTYLYTFDNIPNDQSSLINQQF